MVVSIQANYWQTISGWCVAPTVCSYSPDSGVADVMTHVRARAARKLNARFMCVTNG
jgi:hypothetical protein